MITERTKQKLHVWKTIKEKLDVLKKEESELRDELVEEIFPDRLEGTSTRELGAGFSIKVVQPYTREVDEDALKAVVKKLPKGMKKQLVKTKVSLIKKGYDSLSVDHGAIFDDCLLVKPGKPRLEIVKPKEEEDV